MSVATQSVSRPRRRVHSAAFKREPVEISLVPGASVAGIALEHGINANLLFGWRRAHMTSQSEETSQPNLLPVEIVTPGTPMATATALTSSGNSAPGTIEIELAGARPCVRARARRSGQGQPAQRTGCTARVIGLPINHPRVAGGRPHGRAQRLRWPGRRGTGFGGLAAVAQATLAVNPSNGHVFVFRGRRGDLLKVLWFDGRGLLPLAKRLERGRLIRPEAEHGRAVLRGRQSALQRLLGD